jgi:choline dehydrogenase-like flavoprotein
VYDHIIVGGGSAGSVLAQRLSAKSANKILICVAGQDTPPGNEPPDILDSYSGRAYFDPRFHWTEKVTTQIVSHNNPEPCRREPLLHQICQALGALAPSLEVVQLPQTPPVTAWAGRSGAVASGTLSLILHRPTHAAADQGWAAFLVDEWNETIPATVQE